MIKFFAAVMAKFSARTQPLKTPVLQAGTGESENTKVGNSGGGIGIGMCDTKK